MSKSNLATYDFMLPIFKQGDDLSGHLEHEETNSLALNGLANQYRFAADLCDRLAVELRNLETEVQADTHCIMVTGQANLLDPLTLGEAPLLFKVDWGEDEEDIEEWDEGHPLSDEIVEDD